MNRETDAMLEAASDVERMPGTEGVQMMLMTNRNHVCLQVAMQAITKDLIQAGLEDAGYQIVSSAQGKPLLCLIDTRHWPEEIERKLMSMVITCKAGVPPPPINVLGKLPAPGSAPLVEGEP